jgi:hypothetical protein
VKKTKTVNVVKDLKRKLEAIDIIKSFMRFKGLPLDAGTKAEIAEIEAAAAVEELI